MFFNSYKIYFTHFVNKSSLKLGHTEPGGTGNTPTFEWLKQNLEVVCSVTTDKIIWGTFSHRQTVE